MKKTIQLLAAAFIISSTSTTVLAGAYHHGKFHKARESVQVSQHHEFNTDIAVDGATVLVRDFRARVVTATVSSRALEPDTAYSIWWAVFNYPRFCITPYTCGLGDLHADPRVKPSVFWAGGFVSDMNGIANTSLRLAPGRTSRELFANTKAYGLQNLRGAEIHAVLRSHGTTGIAGPVADQLGTATEACPESGCTNVFASIHAP